MVGHSPMDSGRKNTTHNGRVELRNSQGVKKERLFAAVEVESHGREERSSIIFAARTHPNIDSPNADPSGNGLDHESLRAPQRS
jgi:hypothetical protein